MTETANQGPAALCLLANVSASDQPADCELNLGLGPAGTVDFTGVVGGIKTDDTATNTGSGDGKCNMQPTAQTQTAVSTDQLPIVIAQPTGLLVDGQISGNVDVPRLDMAPSYQPPGLVVQGLRGLTVHSVSYTDLEGIPVAGAAMSSQQQQKDRLKEKQKKYRHRQGQLVRELGELLPPGSGMRSLNQILTAAVAQVRQPRHRETLDINIIINCIDNITIYYFVASPVGSGIKIGDVVRRFRYPACALRAIAAAHAPATPVRRQSPHVPAAPPRRRGGPGDVRRSARPGRWLRESP